MKNKGFDSTEIFKLLEEKENKIKVLEKQIEELKLLTKLDSLTGVLNRRAGMEILEQIMAQCEEKSSKVTIAFLDIDNFKEVNDTYGHIEGDRLLRKLAIMIEDTIRKTDSIFRIGGDEFVIIFSNSNINEVRKICHRITNKLKEYNETTVLPYKVGVSFGLSEYDDNLCKTARELIDLADKEMYRHKRRKEGNQ
ncbi:GGDEF domain-containing protein [Clostridium sp.]|uniref:GGDEF domain-containing protein n=1 Tax=Clostridium sp. TaxID=1506 RepID=UPI002FCAC739